MAANLSFLPNSSGLYILLPSINIDCFMFWMKSSGVSFLNSFHSVTRMPQSAFLMQSAAEEAYSILFLKMNLAFSRAAGSYAVTLAPSFRSWFIIGMDLASLMSSVLGLKASPRMAIFLFFRSLRRFLHNSTAL